MKVFLFITILFTTLCVYAQDPVIFPGEKWRLKGTFGDHMEFKSGGYDFFNNHYLEATESYTDTTYYLQFIDTDSAYMEWAIREVTVIPLEKPDTTYLSFKEVKYIKGFEGAEEEEVIKIIDGLETTNFGDEYEKPIFTVNNYRRSLISIWDACPLKWSQKDDLLTLKGKAPFNGRYKIVNKDKAIILERIE